MSRSHTKGITVMADLTPQNLPPESGWIAAMIITLGAALKGLWPWLKSRDDAQRRLTKEEREAQRQEERDLVITLNKRIDKLEKKVEDMEHERAAQTQKEAAHLQQIAALQARDAERERELKRVRGQREEFRQLSKKTLELVETANAAAASAIDPTKLSISMGELRRLQHEADVLGAQVSEADEAVSLPGGQA